MEPEINSQYGQKVRLRACGLCFNNDKLLMVNHVGLQNGDFWSPPGGGVEFGQTAAQTVIREFEEEAGLIVEAKSYLFSCEFIKFPLHAIELFFEVKYTSGDLKIGVDPETNLQLIKEVRWMSPSEILSLPAINLHGIFRHCKKPEDLLQLKGLWSI